MGAQAMTDMPLPLRARAILSASPFHNRKFRILITTDGRSPERKQLAQIARIFFE
jgi:hypothetical protein